MMPWADLLVAWRQVALYEHECARPAQAEAARRAGLPGLARALDQLSGPFTPWGFPYTGRPTDNPVPHAHVYHH